MKTTLLFIKKHPPVVVIIGAGDATGGAIAKKFAQKGYATVVTRRQKDALNDLVSEIENEGNIAHPFGCDARDEDAMTALFEHIETHIGSIEVAVFNIGANVRFSIADTTTQVYKQKNPLNAGFF